MLDISLIFISLSYETNHNRPMSKNTISSCSDYTNFQGIQLQTLFSLSDFNKKAVEVRFTSEQTSQDAGLLLLSEVYNHCWGK